MDIVTDESNRTWIASERGLTAIDNSFNILHHYNIDKYFINGEKGFATNLFLDSRNKLWISIRNHGVTILDLKTIENNGFNNAEYYNITNEHLYKVGTSSNVVDVFEVSQEEYWISTEKSLFHFISDTKELVLLSDRSTFSFTEDLNNNIWMLSYGGIIKYSKKDSLFNTDLFSKELSPEITNVVTDNENNLWFLSFNSLYKYKPLEKEFTAFHEGHGYKGLSSNLTSCIPLANGKLALGGLDGLVVFSPKELSKHKEKSFLYFSELKFYNKAVAQGTIVNRHTVLEESIEKAKKFIIPPSINSFSIEFSTINFYKPENLKYAYKLEGFDKNWTIVESRERKASYTNLNEGSYTLKIAEVAPLINWKEKYKSIEIVVIPPLHKRLWFQIFIISLVISIIIILVYLRIRSVEKSKIILKNLVEQRTVELRNSNEQLNETNTQLEERQQRIEEQSEELQVQAETLAESNEKLNKTNTQLEERQQQIEEQTVELKWQAESLVTINDQLNETNTQLEERQQQIEEQSEVLKVQTESLTESNATKDKLFSIIAHDLKNPFSSILGFLDMLSIRYKELSDDKRILFISRIQESAEQTYNLLENLLTWSRTQQGRIVFNPEQLNLYETIEESITNTSPLANSKNINLINKLTDKEIIFTADINMVSTILRNLITNSIKFTPNNGVITLNSVKVDDMVVISIKDTGVGMSAETIKEVFHDNNETTQGTNNEKGTGLGLLICKDFIDKHNGSIRVESELDKGSTFFISIPQKKFD